METQLPLPQRGTVPQFSAHIYCDQMARWIKMPLGKKVGLDPSDILHGNWGPSCPTPNIKGAESPNFRPCLLCPNGWMDQNATYYGGRPRPKRHCVRLERTQLPLNKMGDEPPFPIIGPCLLWPNGCMGNGAISMEVGLGPGHIVLDGDPAYPPPKGGTSLPNFRPIFVLSKRLDGSRCATWYDGRPRPGQHCVRCGPSSTPRGTAPPLPPKKFRPISVVAK